MPTFAAIFLPCTSTFANYATSQRPRYCARTAKPDLGLELDREDRPVSLDEMTKALTQVTKA